MFGDLTLQEPESSKVVRSGTGRLPRVLVQVGLVNEAQLRHGLNEPGKMDPNPARDKADHILAVSAATTDPIYQSSSVLDSEGGKEVYMVGDGEKLPEKTTEEIQEEVEEEIAHAAHLARELDQARNREKKHNGL
jgi:hypothetical protein